MFNAEASVGQLVSFIIADHCPALQSVYKVHNILHVRLAEVIILSLNQNTLATAAIFEDVL